MERNNRFFDYLRLIRMQGSASTAAVIIIGSLIMPGEHSLLNFFILFLIGILGHSIIFVLNEYIDIKVDEKSPHLREKPLVSGVIPKNHALFIALLSCFLVYTLTIIFFSSPFTILFLSLALLLGGIYDLLGKKIPGSDLLIAGGCFFLCLFGASTISSTFTNLVYIVSFLIFIYIIFNNAVAGGLKDVDHDYFAGAKTTAIRMGVKVEDGKLLVTRKFAAFAYIAKLIYIGLIVLAGFQPELNLWQSDKYMIHIVMIFLVVIIFATLYKSWHPSKFDRSRLIRFLGISEVTTFFLGTIILLPMLGLSVTLFLLLLPVLWFSIFNVILYGRPMQPQV